MVLLEPQCHPCFHSDFVHFHPFHCLIGCNFVDAADSVLGFELDFAGLALHSEFDSVLDLEHYRYSLEWVSNVEVEEFAVVAVEIAAAAELVVFVELSVAEVFAVVAETCRVCCYPACTRFVDSDCHPDNFLVGCTIKHREGCRYTRNLYGCAIPPRPSITSASWQKL